MKTVFKNTGLCLLCWAVLLGVCFGLLCAAASVPSESIKDNLVSSCSKLASEDPHGASLEGVYHSVRDNYADAVLLGVAANMDSDSVVRSALDTKYYDDGYGPAVGIMATLKGYEANNDYTRYWHGSLVFVRPLLALWDIDGIRAAGTAVIILLMLFDAVWLIRKKHTALCVILLASAVLVEFWFVFTTIEYMSVFIIMLAAVPLYVRFAENTRALVILSAGAGTLTAFFDFLTAETLTLLVPLTAAMFAAAGKGGRPDSKKALRTVILCLAAWGGCYLLTFAAKWAITSVVMGRNVSDVALAAAAERIGGTDDEISSPIVLLFAALGANISMLSPVSEKISLPGLILWPLLFGGICLFIRRLSTRKPNLPKAAALIIAAVPLLRFCVLMNHSYLHCFFTYRALMPTIMILLGMMYFRVGGGGENSIAKSKKHRR